MAIPDGKPATDFSAMNREWVRAVADEAAGSVESGIPAPEDPNNGDVLTYDSTSESWVPAAPGGGGGGGGGGLVITDTYDETTEIATLSATVQQIVAAMQTGAVVYIVVNDYDTPTEYSINYLTGYYISDDPHVHPYTFTFGDGGSFYANLLSDYPQYPGPDLPSE